MFLRLKKLALYIYTIIYVLAMLVPIVGLAKPVFATTHALAMVNYATHNDNVTNAVMTSIKNAMPAILIDNTDHSLWGLSGGYGGTNNCSVSAYTVLGIGVYGYLTGGYEGTSYGDARDNVTLNVARVNDMATIDGVTGVFLDEVSAFPDAADKVYLEAIETEADAHGLKLIFNTGVSTFDDTYLMAHADYVMTDESYSNRAPTSDESPWLSRIIVINNGATTVTNALTYTSNAWITNGFGYTWMTDYTDYGSSEGIASSYLTAYISGLPASTSDIVNPSAISMPRTKVFQNVFSSGDILFMSEYNVSYTNTPTQTPGEAFQYSVYDTTGIIPLVTRPLASTTYGYNVIAIYQTAADAVSNNITWGDADKVKLSGNPAVFTNLTESANMTTTTLSASSWITGTLGSVANKTNIADYITKVIAPNLQTQTGQTLLVLVNGEYVLNSAGRNLFLLAVPQLDAVVPQAFQTSMSSYQGATGNFTQALQSDYTLNGTVGAQIKSSFDGIGTMLGVSGQMVAAMWALGIVLLIASIAFLYSGNTTASLIIAVPFFIVGTYIGAIPLWVFIMGIAILVLYMLYYLVLRGM